MNSSLSMIPSDLYPTSTITSFELMRRTRPRTTSPSARVRRDWSYISSSCSYSPSLSSASTPSIGLRRSTRRGLGVGSTSWETASSGPRVGSSFIFCKSMQAGPSLSFRPPAASKPVVPFDRFCRSAVRHSRPALRLKATTPPPPRAESGSRRPSGSLHPLRRDAQRIPTRGRAVNKKNFIFIGLRHLLTRARGALPEPACDGIERFEESQIFVVRADGNPDGVRETVRLHRADDPPLPQEILVDLLPRARGEY